MEWLTRPISEYALYDWGTLVEDWVFVAAIGLLLFELLRYAAKRQLSWTMIGDGLTSYITLAGYFAILIAGLGTLYVWVYYSAAEFAFWDIPTNALTVVVCVLLADFAYYWEHRFTHRVGIAWATHSVHHSSPHFNLSVANRFGPMDALWPIPFHVPLVLIGFDPLIVFFAEAMVLAYQTFLHTEAVGRLPRPIEFLFNTPSHHRVHHGSNPEYLDRNYGGVLIIWDRMFGSFADERSPVTFGLVEPLNTNNPLTVWFHGFARLFRKSAQAPSPLKAIQAIFQPPG